MINYTKTNNFFEVNMIKDYNSEKMKQITDKEVAFIKRIIPSDSLCLDVMCGYGRIGNKLYEAGYKKLEGIDIGNFDFIDEKKQFVFYNQDLYTWNPEKEYNFCYSLYNSYPSYKSFLETINKCYELLAEKGIIIIDIFSKEWRDSMPRESSRIVFEDSNVLVKLHRDYDGINEKSTYTVFNKKIMSEKVFSFSQCTITKDKLIKIIPNSWDYYLTDSKREDTRVDNQKNILILRKKERK